MTSLAGDHPLLEVDHDSRARIRDDLHRNLFVEAGAGTGKTPCPGRSSGSAGRHRNGARDRQPRRDHVHRSGGRGAARPSPARARGRGDRSRSAAARTRAVRLCSRATRRGDDHDAARLRSPHPVASTRSTRACRLRSRSRTRCRRGFGSTSGGSGSVTTSSPTPTTAVTCCSPRRCGCRPTRRVTSPGCCTPDGTGSSASTSRCPPLPEVDATPIVAAVDKAVAAAEGRIALDGDQLADVVERWVASPCPARRRARGGRRARDRPGARRRQDPPSRAGGDERSCGATPSPPRSRR